MSQNTIPVADLKDYLSDDSQRRKKFIDTVGQSLRDVGFFALTNHGLSDEEIATAYQESQNFFDLSEEAKKGYEDLAIKGQRGYTSFGREHAKDSEAPDLKEFGMLVRKTKGLSLIFGPLS